MGGAHNTAKLFQQLQYILMTLSPRNTLHTKIKEDINNVAYKPPRYLKFLGHLLISQKEECPICNFIF